MKKTKDKNYCEVTIFSSADEGNKTVASGDLEENDNGFCVDYHLNGDSCKITYDGKRFTQTRAGNTQLSISFIERERTACVIECAGNTGYMPVFTRKLQVQSAPDGKLIKIAYILGDMNIELEISVLKI